MVYQGSTGRVVPDPSDIVDRVWTKINIKIEVNAGPRALEGGI